MADRWLEMLTLTVGQRNRMQCTVIKVPFINISLPLGDRKPCLLFEAISVPGYRVASDAY